MKKLSTKISFAVSMTVLILISIFTVYLVNHRSQELRTMLFTRGFMSAGIAQTVVENIFNTMIDDNIFTLSEVFDSSLLPITLPKKITNAYKNASPEQLKRIQKYHYTTGLDSYLDASIVTVQDKFLADKEIVYAVLVDRNGYVPTHNSIVNKKLTGNFVYDLDNNRTKRIFNDPVGLKAARNTTKPYLDQIYQRDTGETMWDISLPVFVKGRHWGAFRIGFSMGKTYHALALLRMKLLVFMAILLISILLTIYLITMHLMKPLQQLHDGVQRVAKGDIHFQQTVTTNDEIGSLGNAFNGMVRDLEQHIKTLQETTRIKEKMESELDIAHNIQQDIIPKLFPPFPYKSELDLYAVLQPARQVGGDLYDFFFVDDDHFVCIVGDVSDKGVPASLFMAVTKTLLKSTAKENPYPDDVLTKVNRELASDNNSCMFATVFCGVLTLSTGTFCFANGGHNAPLIIDTKGIARFLDVAPGCAIGVDSDSRFTRQTIQLGEGDMVYMYTDGITEAVDPTNTLFGEERLLQEVSNTQSVSAKDMITHTLKTIEVFAQGAPQADDMTILAVRYLGKRGKGHYSIIIKNTLSEVKRLAAFVQEICTHHTIQATTINDVALSIEEIIVNTIEYGYADTIHHEIIVNAAITDSLIQITITDDAHAFNPLEQASPNIHASLETRKVGNLGIYFARTLMDSITYTREGNHNIVVMKKNLL